MKLIDPAIKTHRYRVPDRTCRTCALGTIDCSIKLIRNLCKVWRAKPKTK